MRRALLIIDVQNDFCEGGALGVAGGAEVAKRISTQMSLSGYSVIISTQDWHNAPPDSNGGHFALDTDPDFVDSWPVHCVAGTEGADFHIALADEFIDYMLQKGSGQPDYSGFQAKSPRGVSMNEILKEHDITHVDVVGIATDYCVYATAHDANQLGYRTRVLTEMCAGVNPQSTASALELLKAEGVLIV